MVLPRRISIGLIVLVNVPLILTQWPRPRPSKMAAAATRSCSAMMRPSRVRPKRPCPDNPGTSKQHHQHVLRHVGRCPSRNCNAHVAGYMLTAVCPRIVQMGPNCLIRRQKTFGNVQTASGDFAGFW